MDKNQEVSNAASLLAKKAGRATLKKYGKKHYVKMANKRWAKSRSKAKKTKK